MNEKREMYSRWNSRLQYFAKNNVEQPYSQGSEHSVADSLSLHFLSMWKVLRERDADVRITVEHFETEWNIRRLFLGEMLDALSVCGNAFTEADEANVLTLLMCNLDRFKNWIDRFQAHYTLEPDESAYTVEKMESSAAWERDLLSAASQHRKYLWTSPQSFRELELYFRFCRKLSERISHFALQKMMKSQLQNWEDSLMGKWDGDSQRKLGKNFSLSKVMRSPWFGLSVPVRMYLLEAKNEENERGVAIIWDFYDIWTRALLILYDHNRYDTKRMVPWIMHFLQSTVMLKSALPAHELLILRVAEWQNALMDVWKDAASRTYLLVLQGYQRGEDFADVQQWYNEIIGGLLCVFEKKHMPRSVKTFLLSLRNIIYLLG